VRCATASFSHSILHPSVHPLSFLTTHPPTPSKKNHSKGILLLARYARVLDPAAAAGGPPGSPPLPPWSVRHALGGALGAWLLYAFLQGGPGALGPQPSLLVRPHPALWRGVHALGVAYFVALAFLACLSGPGARAVISTLAPSLGARLPERSYASDCRLVVPAGDAAVTAAASGLAGPAAKIAAALSSQPLSRALSWVARRPLTLNGPAIAATVWDEFVIAHVLGWWCKALLLRDRRLLWPLSLGFELAEASLAHALPNFNECWWDAWLLDAAVCNWVGMEVGLACARALGRREVRWVGISRQAGLRAKARRAVLQLTPASWTPYDWDPLASPARAAGCVALVAAVLACELNTFFLKSVLWVPPTHPLVTARIAMLWGLGLPAVAEAYAFLTGGGNGGKEDSGGVFSKLGASAWLWAAVAAAETLVVVKLGLTGGELVGVGGVRPRPAWVRAGWGGAGAVVGVGLCVWEAWRRVVGKRGRGGRRVK
jgi:phosphatidylserine synthase 2